MKLGMSFSHVRGYQLFNAMLIIPILLILKMCRQDRLSKKKIVKKCLDKTQI